MHERRGVVLSVMRQFSVGLKQSTALFAWLNKPKCFVVYGMY